MQCLHSHAGIDILYIASHLPLIWRNTITLTRLSTASSIGNLIILNENLALIFVAVLSCFCHAVLYSWLKLCLCTSQRTQCCTVLDARLFPRPRRVPHNVVYRYHSNRGLMSLTEMATGMWVRSLITPWGRNHRARYHSLRPILITAGKAHLKMMLELQPKFYLHFLMRHGCQRDKHAIYLRRFTTVRVKNKTSLLGE